MLLDSLRYFSWYNEPDNVRFVENGMQIETKPQSDFWQNTFHNIKKDNGHFFYCEKDKDFSMVAHWSFDNMIASDQCGLMLRINEHNWMKISILSPDMRNIQVGTVVTSDGNSDWSSHFLDSLPKEIWFKAIRQGNDYGVFYSLDGISFHQVRMFMLISADNNIKVGAYACSPQNRSFTCVLNDLS